MTVEMQLIGVRVEQNTSQPILLLREAVGAHRLLPIFIGGPEAQAISIGMEAMEIQRPLTHDLIKAILDELTTVIERVVVTNLDNGIFYADLVMHRDGERHVISARPSDAVAIAVRMNVPIYADESVIDEAGYLAEEEADDEEDVPDEVVEQFREFIDTVNPEDFAS